MGLAAGCLHHADSSAALAGCGIGKPAEALALVDRGGVGGYIRGDCLERLAGAPRDHGGGNSMMEPRLQLELAAAELMFRRARFWRELRHCWLGAGASAI